jgi:hypothetical protein
MPNPSKRTTAAKSKTDISIDRATTPPKGGPTPGAMGTGPGATTDEPLNGNSAQADLRSLPLRPETVTPTAPPPTKQELKAAGVPAPKAPPRRRAPLAPKLKMPAPSMPLLEEKVRELIAMQGEHPDQDLIGDMMITALRMVRDGSSRGELKILASSLRELR